MASRTRPVEPYSVPIGEGEREAYRKLRVESAAV
jgi:hypothetical protein